MRVHIGTDHAAFELKEYLVEHLRADGHDVVDHGAAAYDANDDYPVYIIPTAEAVIAEADQGVLGIVLGGSGNGEQIAANKVKGVRAVLADRPELAQLGREHNNANCLALGGRFVTPEEGLEIARVFLATEFTGEQRHARRLQLIADYEDHGSIEA
ncbi:ribose-5-phosphate isomerase [Brooklawnia cerclae]|uniref:Ribose-5-phosphate isomerase B n=1 Tax=Brooklawnia cerclae TaxID=349934 RepID=A0ABX0SKX0_9ACTN|nr:ribose-5-phosphate isomerase [Brooklawnia cerclae]NIH57341.1 ribose 5-phosphate isomerase B [Brooklawnia cerclae]